ncbi:hypothetical protein LPL18_003865 [Halomonas sp. CUBES01]|uniref:hypothetical protein n=1 Tax=Halomonas sp. CUBES01 TaxID=2897340 RepID=UPI001E2EDFD2|nr:hypothetical protein [Halomonas sp. CUBES01]MEC4766473.1 hypothetical protein [Halomonas sp. CUBES01]
MYTCKDWLALHGLNASEVEDVISAFCAGNIECSFRVSPTDNGVYPGSDSISTQESCYRNMVVPALAKAFENVSEVKHLLCNHVEFRGLNNSKEVPYTVCQGSGQPPAVFIDWHGRAEDLLCLVHETAHALQMLLSKNEIMPPVARETCAFIGELLLLDYVKAYLPQFHASLLNVWHGQNRFYLGDCVDALTDALNHPEISYHYYQNYPLARLAAVQVFCATDNKSVSALFSSGREAMAYLPINEMASVGIGVRNPLPVLPPSDVEQPAVDAYRSLGVMALLDIESGSKASYQRIESYYLKLLKNLQERTAFIALDNDNKPVGYATWVESNVDNNMVLTCQTALPSNRINLQRALEKYINKAKDVKASYTRKASKEMLVW